MPGFWQKLFGFLGSAIGGNLATGDPPTGGNLQPRPQQTIGVDTAGTANISFDDHMNFAVTTATNNNLILAPGTNMTIQSGALGGDITLRTHYDNNTMDRLIYFDNGAGTAGTNNNATTWTNGTTTASIQDLRIHENEWRMQQTARHAQHYLQGRINDHLNNQLGQQFNQRLDNTDQQLDAERYARQQRYAAQIMGQPQDYNGLAGQGQAQINIDNYDNVFRPFGGGMRHAPPNLDTPRAIAEARGNNLLKNILGDILYRHYEKHEYVDLPSIQKPGVGFRLRAHRRIGLLKKNKLGQWVEQKESLCIHASGGYWVEGDQVGIHYMLCQCDETKLWKQAIVHRVAA